MTTKEQVKDLLEKWPHLRDSDTKLVATIWLDHTPDARQMSAMDFMRRYAEGSLTPADNITRARRKVQEEHTHLRGNAYALRKEKEQFYREHINEAV